MVSLVRGETVTDPGAKDDSGTPREPTRFESLRYKAAIAWIGVAYRIMPQRYYDQFRKDELREMADRRGLEVMDSEQGSTRVGQFAVTWARVLAKLVAVVGGLALTVVVMWLLVFLPYHIGTWTEQGLTPLTNHQSSVYEISWYWGVAMPIWWILIGTAAYSADKTWGESDGEE